MESKTASSYYQVPYKGDHEDIIVAIVDTIRYALERQPYKEQIGQRVDNFSRVHGSIVVLAPVSKR